MSGTTGNFLSEALAFVPGGIGERAVPRKFCQRNGPIIYLHLPILHSVLGTTTPQDPTTSLLIGAKSPNGEVSDIPQPAKIKVEHQFIATLIDMDGRRWCL